MKFVPHDYQIDLHSTVVLLKGRGKMTFEEYQRYLHSTVVLLKVRILNTEKDIEDIYILL